MAEYLNNQYDFQKNPLIKNPKNNELLVQITNSNNSLMDIVKNGGKVSRQELLEKLGAVQFAANTKVSSGGGTIETQKTVELTLEEKSFLLNEAKKHGLVITENDILKAYKSDFIGNDLREAQKLSKEQLLLSPAFNESNFSTKFLGILKNAGVNDSSIANWTNEIKNLPSIPGNEGNKEVINLLNNITKNISPDALNTKTVAYGLISAITIWTKLKTDPELQKTDIYSFYSDIYKLSILFGYNPSNAIRFDLNPTVKAKNGDLLNTSTLSYTIPNPGTEFNNTLGKIYLYTGGLIDISNYNGLNTQKICNELRVSAEKAGLDEFEAESIDDIETSNYSYIINRVLMGVEMSKEITKTYLFAIDKLYNNGSDKEKSEIKSSFKNNLSESKNQYFKNAFNTLGEGLRKDIIAQINKGGTLKFDYEKILYDMIYAVIDVGYGQKSNLEFINPENKNSPKGGFVDFTSSVESVKKYSPDLYKFLKDGYEPIRIVAEDVSKQKEKVRKNYAEERVKSAIIELELENSIKELNKSKSSLAKAKDDLAKAKDEVNEARKILANKIFKKR